MATPVHHPTTCNSTVPRYRVRIHQGPIKTQAQLAMIPMHLFQSPLTIALLGSVMCEKNDFFNRRSLWFKSNVNLLGGRGHWVGAFTCVSCIVPTTTLHDPFVEEKPGKVMDGKLVVTLRFKPSISRNMFQRRLPLQKINRVLWKIKKLWKTYTMKYSADIYIYKIRISHSLRQHGRTWKILCLAK